MTTFEIIQAALGTGILGTLGVGIFKMGRFSQKMEMKFEAIDTKFEAIEKNFEDIKKDIKTILEELRDLKTRVTIVEETRPTWPAVFREISVQPEERRKPGPKPGYRGKLAHKD